jgi:anti-sigma factor RsiW
MLGISARAKCTDDSVRLLLGLYVLGRLGPADRTRTSEHLSRCPQCAGESTELRGVTVVLDLLSAADVAEIIVAGAASRPS